MSDKNEIMNVENEDTYMPEVVTEEEESSGLSTGAAMAIGSALTLAAIAGFKAVKRALAKRKAKREQETEDVIEGTVVGDNDNG